MTHVSAPGDDDSKVRCRIPGCGTTVSRGTKGSKNLGNGSLHNHLRQKHLESYTRMIDQQGKEKKIQKEKEMLKDETVKGNKLVYSARNKTDRAELIDLVSKSFIS